MALVLFNSLLISCLFIPPLLLIKQFDHYIISYDTFYTKIKMLQFDQL